MQQQSSVKGTYRPDLLTWPKSGYNEDAEAAGIEPAHGFIFDRTPVIADYKPAALPLCHASGRMTCRPHRVGLTI